MKLTYTVKNYDVLHYLCRKTYLQYIAQGNLSEVEGTNI